MIRTHGLTAGLCRGGMFTAADEAGRRAALDDNRRAVDEAAGIGAQCLVLVVGGLPKGSRDIAGARRQVRDGLSALLLHARQAGVPLAIEPLHPMYAADRACVSTLAQAIDLCDELGEGTGVVVDTYHVWWDRIRRGDRRAGRRIVAYHVNDWLVPTTDLLLDRGMMGDGVIDLRRSARWWRRPDIAATARSRSSAGRWWKRDPPRCCAPASKAPPGGGLR